jgi:hypothetical protein
MCTHGVNMLILFYGWPCGKKYHDKIWDRAKKKEEMIPYKCQHYPFDNHKRTTFQRRSILKAKKTKSHNCYSFVMVFIDL